jgi:hypothetical protein
MHLLDRRLRAIAAAASLTILLSAGVSRTARAAPILITGTDAGGSVKLFGGTPLTESDARSPYGTSFTGGVNVGAGDVNGDGVADLVTGTSANAHVKVFDGKTHLEVRSFLPYAGLHRGCLRCGR